MAYSRTRLHNPVVRPPKGPRTPTHIPASLLPLTSNRNAHIVRLYSILVHLVSLPPSPATSVRLVRAWRALAACKEVHLGVLWRLGAAVLEQARDGSEPEHRQDDEADEAAQERAERRAEWLKSCQEGLLDRVDKFAEYALALVAAGRIDFALDELDGCVLRLSLSLSSLAISDTRCNACSYLDNQPYHDSISLNTLYGQLALLSVQPAPLPTLDAAPSSSSSSSSASDSSDDELYPAARNGRSASAGGTKRAAKRARVTARANRQSTLFPRLLPPSTRADRSRVCVQRRPERRD